MNEILAFTMISLLLVISPGPNTILILKTVGRNGKKAGIENILGLVSATFLHGAISILGLSAVILQSAELFTLIKYLGAAYLLYLGLKTIFATFRITPRGKVASQLGGSDKNQFHLNYMEGFLTQVLNPKVSMFYLAAFPQFLDFDAPNYYGAFLLVSIHALIIFWWFLGVTVCIQRIKSLSKEGTLSLWFQRLSGGLLVYFGSLLVAQEARN